MLHKHRNCYTLKDLCFFKVLLSVLKNMSSRQQYRFFVCVCVWFVALFYLFFFSLVAIIYKIIAFFALSAAGSYSPLC